MPRIARVVLPGYPHHVTQRGNRRQKIFFCDEDYQTYINLLADACEIHYTEAWAWCLMPNHVHLVLVPSSEDGLRSTISETHRRYTRRINLREGWRGHLWQERFHSFPMDESYLLATVRYVELDPVKAKLVIRPQDWPWSSAPARLGKVTDKLTRQVPLNSLIQDWPAFWLSDDDGCSEEIRQHTQTGRPLGSSDFITDAELQLGRVLRRKKPGPKQRYKIENPQLEFES